MSRNIDKANQTIFENIKLGYICSKDYTDDSNLDNCRYLAGTPEEKQWLIHFQINPDTLLNFWNENTFLIGEYSNKKYLITIGMNEFSILPDGFTNIPLNAGSFLAIVSGLNLMVKSEYPPLKIFNEVLSQHCGISDYTGHDFNELKRLFPAIYLYQIDENIYGGDINSIEQMSCIFLTYNREYLRLPYNEETLICFRTLLYLNYKDLRYENIFQALTATNFKYSFLDIYRLIEMLYQLCYMIDIEKRITGVDKFLLLETIDSSLSWKPNERNTLLKIFNSISVSKRPIITKKLPNIIKRTTNQTIANNDALWSWIYDLRCNIVHLKTYHSNIKISNRDWDLIIHGLLEVIIAAYELYD